MIATKKNWLKRTLSLLLAFVMLLSISILNVFAVDTDELPTGYKRAVQLKAPAEDGVYYADIDLMNYSQMGQTSMGNSALRGSKNFLQKHPEDTGIPFDCYSKGR